ncbi:DUF3021 family protein [Gracilibacillus sp. HCP3S3_G5_1]|uniref:DUF3021 family protein n=1 Tax=unclassified Gracilibacillus TaxID=2625209 RepID=UPI003F899232
MVINALLRGGIPFIIMSGIALLLNYQEKYSDAKSTFFASLIAFFVGATTVIYNIDHWSLTKQSVVHFLIMLITVYPILLLSGWFTIVSVFDALKVFLVFILVGVILWLVMFILAIVFSW